MAAPSKATLLKLDIEALDIDTRLQLIEELWDSIVQDVNDEGAELLLTEAQKTLLDERLREDDEDPDSAIPYDEAMRRIRTP